jgi:putative transposase
MAHLEDCLREEGSPLTEGVIQALSAADPTGSPDAPEGAGESVLVELIRRAINAALLLERQRHLRAEPYERTPERQGHANGFKEKTEKTRLGPITFSVPQVREGGFAPVSLENGLRSERALKVALAQMYVQGVSTRKVAAITEALCGLEVSASEVSRAAAELDGTLEGWRNRPLGACPYVTLDARYEKVRIDGQVRDAAVLIATGVGSDGKRDVLGVSVSLSEAEVHWRSFLLSLKERGLSGVELLTSDNHPGLRAAWLSIFGGVPWQRCQFHLQQNAQGHVPKQSMKKEVAQEIRTVFNAPDRQEAERLLRKAVEKYAASAPKLAAWMEENLPEGFGVFAFPEAHRRFLRTTNGLERLNQEIKRRTRVVRIFPNEASCLRLVSALLMETAEDWQTDKAYLTFTDT